MDKIERTILLQELRSKILYIGFDKLQLKNLEPLRHEVEWEIDKLVTSLVFRIRKQYFDAIVSGEKTTEFRPTSPFWRKRIEGKGESLDTAVFICGKLIHRRKITLIQEVETPSWFSKQGQRDVDTPTAYAIHLGSEI